MKTVELPPIRETKEDYEDIRKEILDLLRRELYLPLIRELRLPKRRLENAVYDLLAAIRAGRVHFDRGLFTGSFNAKISKELSKLGAKWDRAREGWKIEKRDLTPEILQAIAASDERFKGVIDKIDKKLGETASEAISERLDTAGHFDRNLKDTDERIRKQVDRVRGGGWERRGRDRREGSREGGGISVVPHLTDFERQKIAEEYTQNLRLEVKEWADEEVLRLRKRVQGVALSGGRYESLVREIQTSYGAAQNKAKFLAREETRLMMTKFKGARYQDAGSEEYVWNCVAGSPNHPVRPMHKELDGKTFRWDDPPVVNEKGEKKNPGEDYGCRCTPRPIIRF